MAKANARLDAARKAYREALDEARRNPTPDAWSRLLAAGKELSAAEDPRPRGRRARRPQPRAEETGEVQALDRGRPADEPLEGLE